MKDKCPGCGKPKCKRSKQCQSCYLKFMQSYLRTPEVRKRQSRLSKGRKHSEETRRKLSEIKKAHWEAGVYDDPETRKKYIAQIMKNATNSELGARHSDVMKKAWARGVYDGQHDSPEYRQKHLAGLNAYWRKKAPAHEPYGPKFNSDSKRIVKERDGHICQICGLLGRDIHHIDYNKRNNELSNLVYLCQSCHSKTTHGNRKYWQAYLTGNGYELMLGAY